MAFAATRVHTPAGEAAPLQVPATVSTVTADRLPLAPGMAVALRRIVVAPHASVREMVELLAGDPLLLGHMLIAARRAGRPQLRSVQDAAAALERPGVANLCVQHLTEGYVFRTRHYGACLASVSRHARATGHLAHLLAAHLGADGREAYLAGVLHEAGFAAALVHVGSSEAPPGTVANAGPPLDLEWPRIEAVAPAVTAELCNHWGVHPEIIHALGAMHGARPAATPLECTLHLAHILADALGRGVVTPWGTDAPDPTQFIYAAAPLGIDGARARQLLEAGRARLEGVK